MTRPVPGIRPVEEMLRSPQRVHRLLVVDRSHGGPLRGVVELAAAAGVEVESAPQARLDEMVNGVNHQGVVAIADDFPYRRLSDLGDAATPFLVALDGVTDPHNLGAIARTAEVAGAAGLVLQERRAAPVTPAAEKAAAGAFAYLPVARVTNLSRALAELGERGVWSVGLDAAAAESLWDCPLLDEACVIVVGDEGRGLSRLVSERCDARVALPVAGRVSSLNASVAAAIALYEVVRRRSANGAARAAHI